MYKKLYKKQIPLIQSMPFSTALAIYLGFGLLANPALMTVAKASPSFPSVGTADITEVRTQAAQYSQAMNVIAALGTTSVTTKDAATRAVESIKKVDSILNAGLPKRLTIIALDNRTFKQTIEQETARLGPKVFYERVTSNPQLVSTLRGASEIKLAITRQLQSDAATLKTTAAYLKRVAMANRQANNSHDQNPINAMFIQANYVLPDSGEEFEPNMCPQGGVGESLIVAALVGAAVLLIGSYAAILSKGHEVPSATEENPNPVSPVARCLDEAIARRDRCLNASDVWGDIVCAAVYLADRADCLLLPQA